MAEDIKCLKSKDYGAIIIRALSYCLLICGILLIVQQNISISILTLGVKIVALISGVALIFNFVLNSRSRFRPGWTLQMAILLCLIGGLYLFLPLFNFVKMPTASFIAIIICMAAINSVLLLSAGVQLRSLVLKRWIVLVILGLINGIFAVFVFIDLFSLRTDSIFAVAIFMIIFAVQCFLEGVYSLWKL